MGSHRGTPQKGRCIYNIMPPYHNGIIVYPMKWYNPRSGNNQYGSQSKNSSLNSLVIGYVGVQTSKLRNMPYFPLPTVIQLDGIRPASPTNTLEPSLTGTHLHRYQSRRMLIRTATTVRGCLPSVGTLTTSFS